MSVRLYECPKCGKYKPRDAFYGVRTECRGVYSVFVNINHTERSPRRPDRGLRNMRRLSLDRKDSH